MRSDRYMEKTNKQKTYMIYDIYWKQKLTITINLEKSVYIQLAGLQAAGKMELPPPPNIIIIIIIIIKLFRYSYL